MIVNIYQAAAVMVIFNTIIVFASFLTKPLYSLLSENFYSQIDEVKSFIKKDKDFLIQRIFNISIFISLLSFILYISWHIYSKFMAWRTSFKFLPATNNM